MNYVPRNKKSLVPKPIQITAVIAVVLVVFHVFIPSVLPSFFTMLARPFWGNTSHEEFEKVLREMRTTSTETDALVAENLQLKNELGRTDTSHPLLAVILKRPPVSAYDTFILDVGSTDGVKVDDLVYALGNIPIGKIAETFGNTSKVRLYSSSDEKFDILIGSTSIATTAIGKGGGFFEASMPRDTKIKVGDRVLIPALNNAFVGTVEGVASEASEPFSKVLFRQPVNMYEMRWVFVEVK